MSIEIACDAEGVEEFKQAMERLDYGMQQHVHRQLEIWAAEVQALARQLIPVRTGYLKSTIYAKISEWVAEIGAEATYALFVEFGTRRMRAQPYLYPSIQEHLPRLEAIICDAIDNAKTGAGLT